MDPNNPEAGPIIYNAPTTTPTSYNSGYVSDLANRSIAASQGRANDLASKYPGFSDQIAAAQAAGFTQDQIDQFLASRNAAAPTAPPSASPTAALQSVAQIAAPKSQASPAQAPTTLGITTGKLAQYTPGGNLALGLAQHAALGIGNDVVKSNNKSFNDQITSINKQIARTTDPAKITRLKGIAAGVYQFYGIKPPADVAAAPIIGGGQTLSGTDKPMTAQDVAATSNNGKMITNKQMAGSALQLAALGAGGLATNLVSKGAGAIGMTEGAPVLARILGGAIGGGVGNAGYQAAGAYGEGGNAQQIKTAAEGGAGSGALFGGALSAAGELASKAKSALSPVAKNAGLQTMGAPLGDLPPRLKIEADAPATTESLYNQGVKSMDENTLAAYHDAHTGANGVSTKIMHEAAANAGPVNIGPTTSINAQGMESTTQPGLREIGRNIVDNTTGLDTNPTLQKSLSNRFDSVVNGLIGKNLEGTANASEVLSAQQAAAQKAANFARIAQRTNNVDDIAQAEAWKSFSEELQDRLGSAQNIDQATKDAIKNHLPDVRSAQQQLKLNDSYTKNFQDIATGKDGNAFQNLRSNARVGVNAGKFADALADARKATFGRNPPSLGSALANLDVTHPLQAPGKILNQLGKFPAGGSTIGQSTKQALGNILTPKNQSSSIGKSVISGVGRGTIIDFLSKLGSRF